jgi:hypothetical protein
LFLIVVDLLHRMIAHEDNGLDHPLLPGLPTPVIQYADETLIMLQACPSQLRRLKEIFDKFATVTGLHINFHKSTFMHVNVNAGDALELVGILGYPVTGFPSPTWGSPSPSPRSPPLCSRHSPSRRNR